MEPCSSGLYTLKFCILDHVVKDRCIFGTLSIFDGLKEVRNKYSARSQEVFRKTDGCIIDNVKMVGWRTDDTTNVRRTLPLEGERKSNTWHVNQLLNNGTYLMPEV